MAVHISTHRTSSILLCLHSLPRSYNGNIFVLFLIFSYRIYVRLGFHTLCREKQDWVQKGHPCPCRVPAFATRMPRWAGPSPLRSPVPAGGFRRAILMLLMQRIWHRRFVFDASSGSSVRATKCAMRAHHQVTRYQIKGSQRCAASRNWGLHVCAPHSHRPRMLYPHQRQAGLLFELGALRWQFPRQLWLQHV